MSEKVQKILYDHYVKMGNKVNIKMMLKAYPHFADKPTPDKSKGKK